MVTDLLDWAADRPLFTVNEAQRATGMRRASLREKLSRLARRGDLLRVERGKYTVHDDPLLYGTYVETPSYLSLWTGLRYYDLTTQEPTGVQVITAEHRPDLDTIQFFASQSMFGFGRRRYAGFDIFVADPERLLIDCLARREVPIGELRDLVERVDIPTCTDYAERLDRNSVRKRLGYLFDHVRGESVTELGITDRNYPLLDLNRPPSGETDATWRLRVNTDAV